MPQRKTLASLAKTTKRKANRGRPCEIDTIPGARRDLDRTIRAEFAKPRKDRHDIKTLYDLMCEAYPGFAEQMLYNGFWRHVTTRYGYHGKSAFGEVNHEEE